MLVEAKFIYIDENMDNQKNCRSIKQARLIVNAHKRNLLNSFCNNGYVYVKQHENNNKNQSKIERERERERERECMSVCLCVQREREREEV